MNKLWVFGDSFSVPFITPSNVTSWISEYVQWKGYIPKCYSEFIFDELKIKYTNLAKSGADNYTILDTIIACIDVISPLDIIIIGWSNTSRFRVVNKSNTFTTIYPNELDSIFKKNKNQSLFELSNSTITEMSINRDSRVYVDELNNYIKLLNYAFPNNKIIHWSPFYLDRYGLSITIPNLNNLETISKETNGVVNDNHFSENAHKLIANQLIYTIQNFKNTVLKKSIV
jgi:hypothetical protein